MIKYYTYVILITLSALFVFSILVYENDRILPEEKRLFILTNFYIGIAAVAECVGVYLNGNTDIPKWVLFAVKAVDYTFTPMTGGTLMVLMEGTDKMKKLYRKIFAGNGIVQILAAVYGLMINIDENHRYTHGVLYPAYIAFYLVIIGFLAAKTLSYGKKFRNQNRKSLYAIMALVIVGVSMQDVLRGDCRVAYLTMTFGAVFLFIHHCEFSQIQLDDKISRQQTMIETDILTGMFSRYAYIEASKAYDSSMPEDLVVFLIDINGLKTVNDQKGHEAGDELICAAAECIHTTLGKSGKTFRIGGDEFVVFAAMTGEEAACAATLLKDKASRWSGALSGQLSLSVGYALAKEEECPTVEELVEKADKRMYEQKKEYYETSGYDRRRR